MKNEEVLLLKELIRGCIKASFVKDERSKTVLDKETCLLS